MNFDKRKGKCPQEKSKVVKRRTRSRNGQETICCLSLISSKKSLSINPIPYLFYPFSPYLYKQQKANVQRQLKPVTFFIDSENVIVERNAYSTYAQIVVLKN